MKNCNVPDYIIFWNKIENSFVQKNFTNEPSELKDLLTFGTKDGLYPFKRYAGVTASNTDRAYFLNNSMHGNMELSIDLIARKQHSCNTYNISELFDIPTILSNRNSKIIVNPYYDTFDFSKSENNYKKHISLQFQSPFIENLADNREYPFKLFKPGLHVPGMPKQVIIATDSLELSAIDTFENIKAVIPSLKEALGESEDIFFNHLSLSRDSAFYNNYFQ